MSRYRPNPIVLSTALIAAGALLTAVGAAGEVRRAGRRPSAGLFVERKITGGRQGLTVTNKLERIFGEPSGGDFPAPYRYADAKKIASIVIQAASETAPAFRQHYDTIRSRMDAIDRSNRQPFEKTHQVIQQVVLPAYASNLFWHWYRPRSRVKQDRFTAIISWAVLFYTTPVTANTEDPKTIRGMLLDVHRYLREWRRKNTSNTGNQLESLSAQRLDDLVRIYPSTDRPEYVQEGNLKIVDELVWLATARVEESIQVNFDEGAAWAGLVIQVVGAIVSAVAGFASPAVTAAVQSAATVIQGVARMMVDPQVSQTQVQALMGAGVTYMLDQAAIRLGLEDEMAEIEDVVKR